jgi:hypothetical protein
VTQRVERIAAALRQLAFPREFRIAPAEGESGPDDLSGLLSLLANDGGGGGEPPGRPADPLDPALVRRLANVTWNLRGQVQRLGETTFDRALKGRIDILTQALEDAGIELIDFTGQDFDEGDFWDEVVAAEGQKLHPVIVGMSKPRVKYRNVLIQRGMPIVEDRSTEQTGGASV